MKSKLTIHNFDFTFTDEDIVNLDNFIPDGEYNPHKIHPWLFHDHGFTIGVVFAEHLQDALDEIADSGRIDHFKVTDKEMESDYDYDEKSGEYSGITFLGNYGNPYDIESLDFVELSNPKMSFCALFNAKE